MARQIKQTVIDDQKYEIGQYMGHKAMPLFFKVSKRIAPIIGAMKALSGDEGETLSQEDILDSDISKLVDTILPYLMDVLENLDDPSTMDIICEILTVVKYQGHASGNTEADYQWSTPGPILIEKHFTGEPMHMMKVVVETLRHNYKDFLGGIPFQKLMPTMKR